MHHPWVYFIIYLTLIVLTYVVGGWMRGMFPLRMLVLGAWRGLFVRMLMGALGLGLAYSLIVSGGRTVHLFFLPVLLVLHWGRKEKAAASPEPEWNTRKALWQLGVLALLPFLYFVLALCEPVGMGFRAVDFDAVVYGELSEQLRRSGLESRWQVFFQREHAFIEPYHYLELWWNALAGIVPGTNPVIRLYLVTYPFWLSLALLGVLAVWEQLASLHAAPRPRGWKVFLAFLLLFIGPLYEVQHHDYHFSTSAAELPWQHLGEKFSVYYPFCLFLVLLLLQQQQVLAFAWLQTVWIVSFTTFPAIALFSWLYLCLIIRRSDPREFWRMFIWFLLLQGSVLLFYDMPLRGAASTGLPGLNLLQAIGYDATQPWLSIKRALGNFLAALPYQLWYCLANYAYAPLLLLLLVFAGRLRSLKILTPFLGLFAIGLFVALFLSRMPDHFQLFNNTLPLWHVLLITGFLMLFCTTKGPRAIALIGACVLTGISLSSLYSSLNDYRITDNALRVGDTYLERLATIAHHHPSAQAGIFYTQEDLEEQLGQANGNRLYFLSYASFRGIPLKLSCVSVQNFSKFEPNRAYYELINRQEPFYRYFQHQSPNNQHHPDSLILRYIREQKLPVIIFSPKTKAPDWLMARAKWGYTDSVSGFSLISLAE